MFWCRYSICQGQLCSQHATFAPDGKKAAVTDTVRVGPGDAEIDYAHSIVVVDSATGKPRGSLKVLDRSFPVAWSPDGRTLACGAEDARKLVLREAGTGKERLSVVAAGNQWVRFATFAPDGKSLAVLRLGPSPRDDKPLSVFDTQTGKKTRDLTPGGCWGTFMPRRLLQHLASSLEC